MVLLYLQRTPGAKAFSETSQAESAPTTIETKDVDHIATDGAAFLGILNKRMKQFATKYCLTLREEEICLHIAKGHAIKTIASELCISDNTVWTHIKNIYTKCNVSSKPQLIELIEEWLNLESQSENK